MMDKHVEKALDRAAEVLRGGVESLADLTETTSGGRFPAAPALEEALARETGLVNERQKKGIPSGWPQRSSWDACLWSVSSARSEAAVAIKWVPGVPPRDSGNFQIRWVVYDIFKLGRAVEEGTIERGYMIMGASAAWWKSALRGDGRCGQRGANRAALFDGCEDVLATDSRWGSWRNGRDVPEPHAITLSSVGRSRISPVGDEGPWEMRCVRVTA